MAGISDRCEWSAVREQAHNQRNKQLDQIHMVDGKQYCGKHCRKGNAKPLQSFEAGTRGRLPLPVIVSQYTHIQIDQHRIDDMIAIRWKAGGYKTES